MTALSGWENFYVIVGSSAGALIGLQFVVITLIADTPLGHGAAQAGDAFCDADHRSLRSRTAAGGASKRPLARDCSGCGSLGAAGFQWGSVRCHRGSSFPATDRIQARIRGLVVSCSATVCRIRNAVGVCVSGLLSQRRGAIWRFSGGSAAPFHWHS